MRRFLANTQRTSILSWVILPLSLSITYPASAATAWFFDGACFDSRVKWGTQDDDLTKEAGDPIRCDKAVLIELKNGRKLINFTTGRGVLGFAGPVIDRETNPKMAIMPIDRIYPIRDTLGMSLKEVTASGSRREGALEGAEGFCFFETKDFKMSKYETGNKKTVYSIKMKVRKVSKRANFPDL